MSLFDDFWGPERLLCDTNIGRKLLLGQEHTETVWTLCHEGGKQKGEIHDLVILAQ